MRRLSCICVGVLTAIGLVGCAAQSAQTPAQPAAAQESTDMRPTAAPTTATAASVVTATPITAVPIVYFMDAFG